MAPRSTSRLTRGDSTLGRGRARAGPPTPDNALGPRYRALSPSSPSIRSSRLYLATRSERDGAPVLIWPVPIATTRSAIVVSSVSPERCETTADQPARRASAIASIVSVSVPIWLSLMRTELALPSSMPRPIRSVLVTNRSSPTSWIVPPSRSVSCRQPAQSSSARPSSIDTIG